MSHKVKTTEIEEREKGLALKRHATCMPRDRRFEIDDSQRLSGFRADD